MADLRIADAPEIALENITGNEKIPTGGYGNSAVTITNIGEFARTALSLATESYVSNAVGQKENKITLTGLNLTPTPTLVEIPQTNNSVLNTIHQDLLNRMEWIKDNISVITDHQALTNRSAFNTHPSSSISHNGTSNVSIEIEELKNDILTINNTTVPELENAILPLITGNITSSGNVEYPEFSAYSTIKINNVPLKRPFNMINYFFEKPKDFTWNANGHKFWIDGDGLIQSNIVPSTYDVASQNSPVEYFVSLTGNNTQSNPGTDPANPLRSITRALTLIQTNANTNAVIWIQAGSYNDGNTWGSTVSVASNVSIKVWNMSLTAPFNDTTESVVVLPTNDTTLVWTLDSGNTYKTTRPSAHAVVDFAITNRYGDSSFYEKAETLAECNSTAGTWFLDTGTNSLYVHTLNNRAPDSSIQVYVNKTLGRMTTGNYTLYMERIWFYGGTSPFAASIDAGNTTQTLFAYKCRFWYGAENGLAARGTSLNIMYKCSCAYNRDDGFNYHSELGGTTRKPKTIEYKCIAYRNGQKWSPLVLTNQGSTTHDGSDIVRVGCTYFDNGRQCVTDVGGSLSWIMGSKGSASEKRFEGSYYSVFQCAEGKMWLDHCDAAGHDYALACTSGGKIFVRNCNLYPRFYTAQSISNW